MARYGHQPLSEILSLTYRELDLFAHALSDLVAEENDSRAFPGGEG